MLKDIKRYSAININSVSQFRNKLGHVLDVQGPRATHPSYKGSVLVFSSAHKTMTAIGPHADKLVDALRRSVPETKVA